MKSAFYQVYDWLDYMPLKMHLRMMCICMTECGRWRVGLAQYWGEVKARIQGERIDEWTPPTQLTFPTLTRSRAPNRGMVPSTFRLCLPSPIKAARIIPKRHAHSQDDLDSPSPRFSFQVVLACTKSTIRAVIVLYSSVTPPQRRKTTGSCIAMRPKVKEI